MRIAVFLLASLAWGADRNTPQCRFIDLLEKVTTERRGLDDDALAHLQKAETPRNPIEPEDTSLAPIVRHSYHDAFARLIDEGIAPDAWKEIQTEVGKLREKTRARNNRVEKIRDDTAALVAPIVHTAKFVPETIPYSNFKDQRFKTFVARDGTTFVLYTTEADRGAKTNRIVSIDAATGETKYLALQGGRTGEMTELADGRVVIVEQTNTLRLCDVRAGKELGWGLTSADRSSFFPVETPKGLAIIVGNSDRAVSLDPVSHGLNGQLTLPRGDHFYFQSKDATKLYATTFVNGKAAQIVVTEALTGTELFRDTLDQTPAGVGIQLALHEDEKGTVRVAVRAGSDVYLLENGTKRYFPGANTNRSTTTGGFVVLPDRMVGYVPEPVSGEKLSLLHFGTHPTDVFDFAKPAINPTALITSSDGSPTVVGAAQVNGALEVEMTNLNSRGRTKVRFPPGLHLDHVFRLANGGIGGLAWDGGSLSILQFYGPRK